MIRPEELVSLNAKLAEVNNASYETRTVAQKRARAVVCNPLSHASLLMLLSMIGRNCGPAQNIAQVACTRCPSVQSPCRSNPVSSAQRQVEPESRSCPWAVPFVPITERRGGPRQD